MKILNAWELINESQVCTEKGQETDKTWSGLQSSGELLFCSSNF